MSQLIALLSLIGFLIGVTYVFEKAHADYDPNAVCARQTEISKEQCLSAINYAMSAGW